MFIAPQSFQGFSSAKTVLEGQATKRKSKQTNKIWTPKEGKNTNQANPED